MACCTDPLPAGIGWRHTLGFAALAVLAVQALSGLGLAFHYVPSTDLAYDSVRAFRDEQPNGRLVWQLHVIGGIACIALPLLVMLRSFIAGAYKGKQKWVWVTGVIALLILIKLGITGELLPWTEQAYFATQVRTNVIANAPIVGEQMREIALGGDAIAGPTLTRFYVLHVVALPALLGLALWVHFRLLSKRGLTAPGAQVGEEVEAGKPWFPDHVVKQAVVGIVVVGVLVGIAASVELDGGAVAEPGDTNFQAWPEWHMLWLNLLLKWFPGSLQSIPAFWFPGLLVLGMLLLPFLDRNPSRSLRDRKLALGGGAVLLLGLIALSLINQRDKPTNVSKLPYALGLTPVERMGYLAVRRHKCGDCHAYSDDEPYTSPDREIEGTNYVDIFLETPEEFLEVFADPPEDMPDYSHVPLEEQRAMALFLLTLQDG